LELVMAGRQIFPRLVPLSPTGDERKMAQGKKKREKNSAVVFFLVVAGSWDKIGRE
jgi:hypothetical protein